MGVWKDLAGLPQEAGGWDAMRLYRTGDICPLCGQPIRLTDPGELFWFSYMAIMLLGLPSPEENCKDIRTEEVPS